VILGDDKGSSAFNRFARSVNDANKAVDKNNAALKQSGKSSVAAQGGFLALTGTITGFSDAMNVTSKKTGLFAKGMAGLGLATGLLEPELAGLTVAAGGAAAAFAAAGVGLGAYQLVIKNVMNELAKLKQLQQAAATGNKAAGKALQAYLKTLSPAFKEFNNQLDATKKTYEDWGRSLEAPVLGPLTRGLKFVKPLLADLSPIVRTASAAIGYLVDRLGTNIAGGGFAKWLAAIRPAIAPAITDLGLSIGHIVVGLGGVIKAFVPFAGMVTGGIEHLTAAFAKWGTTLTSHSGFQALIAMFKKDTPVVNEILKNLAVTVKNVASSMAAFSSPSNSFGLLNTLKVLSGILAKLSANKTLVNFVLQFLLLKSIVGQVLGPLKIFGGLVGTTGSAIEDITKLGFVPWLKQIKLVTIAQKIWNGVQVAFNIIMRANPIILVGTLLVGLVAAVIYAYKHFKWFRDFVNAVWAGILATVKAVVSWFQHSFVPFFTRTIPHAWSAAWNWIKNAAKAAWDFLTHGWGQFLIPGITLIRKVIEVVRDHWRDAWNAIKTVAVTVWHVIERVVINPLKSIWNWLKNAFNFVKSVGGFLSGGGASGQASPRVAQQYALSQLGSHGWDVSQMVPLTDLWQQESGWSNIARNKSSGAYGIPQALPPSKMGPAANPPQSSYIAQINWGLSYIKGRYGSPAGAWAHERAYNWYGGGGMIREPVMGIGMRSGRGYGLGERGSELVTPAGALERRLDMIASLLGDLIGAVDDNAPRTAAGVARAFGNATRGSDYTALYGAR
jgi:hypothetical protein